jgi:hypothetical protein
LYFLKEKQILELIEEEKNKENNPPVDAVECRTINSISTLSDTNGGTDNTYSSDTMESEEKHEAHGTSTAAVSVNTINRGHPKDTTIVLKASREKHKKKCIKEITKIYANKLDVNKKKRKAPIEDIEDEEVTETNTRTSGKFLLNLIKSKWQEYGLDMNKMVPCNTIRTRYKQGRLSPVNRGTRPLLPPLIEQLIIETTIKCSKMRQSLSVNQIISFANSIIQGSKYHDHVVEWKKRTSRTYQQRNTKLLVRAGGVDSVNDISMKLS